MDCQFKFKIGQLIYDEYYGLGMIIKKKNFRGRYNDYLIHFCEPSKDLDEFGVDCGWFAEQWVEDKVNEPCLAVTK